MFTFIVVGVVLAFAVEFLIRKFGPKVEADVKAKVSAEVATVKADVAKVEAKLP